MQYYALDGESIVQAIQAVRQKNYLCPECRSPVRLRKGPERQPHFYHLSAPSFCNQNNKSLTHLTIQWILQALLPPDEAVMERIFSSIGRIADVAWEKQKIVFEIQCSPITAEEALQRCEAYKSIGYEPVWILHDKRYNKRRSSLAETYLRKNRCYYTDIDEKGHGKIYDQWDIAKGGRRIFRGPPLPVDLTKPLLLQKSAPEELALRFLNSHLYFQGDFCDRYLKAPPSPREIKHVSIAPLQTLLRAYKTIFRFLLESVCR